MFMQNRILMDKIEEDTSPSGYGTEDSSSTTTTSQTQAQGDSSDNTSKGAADQGVSDQKAEDADKSKQAAATEDVTGYTKTDDKGDAKDAAVTEDKPLELEAKGLSEEQLSVVQEFAKAQKLTKEQAQGLVDKIKSDADVTAAKQAEMKQAEAQVYSKWEKELKEDAEFGGQNFAQNVHNVNKLIREEIPALKNLLTTSGKRLPPSVMKDLNNVARKLYGETEFNQGAKTGKESTWHPTDFYKQKQ